MLTFLQVEPCCVRMSIAHSRNTGALPHSYVGIVQRKSGDHQGMSASQYFFWNSPLVVLFLVKLALC